MKRKSSDQRRVEARGRHKEGWEVQSEPQGLCARSNFIVIFMGMFFFHDLFPLFAWQMHAHTHPHKQTVTTFHASNGNCTAIKDVVKLHPTALCCPDSGIATFKRHQLILLMPYCISALPHLLGSPN